MLAKRDAYYEHYWQCGACTKARSTGNTKECEQGIRLRQECEHPLALYVQKVISAS